MFILAELHFLNVSTSHSDVLISNVSIDSRSISENGLYIPIKGPNNNGHHYLHQAISNGAVAALWESTEEAPNDIPNDFVLIQVDSTFHSLYAIADFYRNKVNPIVIGITGSNGKTTTKDICYSLLSTTFATHKTSGNLNNHFGVPLTLLSMPPETEVCIVEMGMSGLGEIRELSLLAKPNYAIITNIGESHLAQLKTRANIAIAKCEIIEGLSENGLVIFDGDEKLLAHVEGISISFSGGDTPLQVHKMNNDSISFSFLHHDFVLPMLGKHHAKNAAYAIYLAQKLGVDFDVIKTSLQYISLTGMRMERFISKNGVTLINDAYNASPVSMKGAIEAIQSLNGFSKKVLVLGDMLELGEEEESLHRSVAYSINDSITDVIVCGDRGKWIGDELFQRKLGRQVNTNVHFANSLEQTVSIANSILDKNSLLLAKASRGMKLDAVVERLLG